MINSESGTIFYAIPEYNCIAVAGYGLPQIKQGIGIFIKYDNDTVKFIDNNEILLELDIDDIDSVLLAASLFVNKYLVLGGQSTACDELHSLIYEYIYMGLVS